jgi:hypothetical protein
MCYSHDRLNCPSCQASTVLALGAAGLGAYLTSGCVRVSWGCTGFLLPSSMATAATERPAGPLRSLSRGVVRAASRTGSLVSRLFVSCYGFGDQEKEAPVGYIQQIYTLTMGQDDGNSRICRALCLNLVPCRTGVRSTALAPGFTKRCPQEGGGGGCDAIHAQL